MKIDHYSTRARCAFGAFLLAGHAAFSVAAYGQVTFHSDFDEPDLASITGLTVDTPSTSGAGSGTVSLDTVSERLDLTANAANHWTARNGSPIAWVARPNVTAGQTWYVQTQVIHTDSTGSIASTYDQAGITFYSGDPGGYTSNSLYVGINDWNAWSHRIQGLGDNNPNVSVAASGTGATNAFEYRVEITENGASDLYNFFFREDPSDPWTQYGTPNLAQGFDNSAVGMWLKSNAANTTAETEFEYFTVGVIPENAWVTDGSGNWSTPANWGVAVPNAQSAEAIFRDSLPFTGPLTASLDAATTIGSLSLESAEAITIDGANTLTFDGGGAATVSATAGSHLISAPVALTDPLGLSLTSGSELELSGALTGTTSVTNSGGGQLTLSGDLSGHTGSIVSDAGSLVVSGTGASDITVNAGSLAVPGATASNVTVNAGTAELTGTVGGDVTIADGVTLSGEGSNTGALNLAAGSALSVDPSNGATAFTTGTLSPTATAEIEFTSSPIGLGSFTVMNFTTYAGTVASDFVSDYRLTLTDTSSSITAIASTPETSNWTGADVTNPTFWDNGTSTNWSSGDTLFYSEDVVTFTDVGVVDRIDGDTGATVRSVSVQEGVAPGTLTFTNTFGNDWEIQDLNADVETIKAEDGGIVVTGGGNVTMFTKITGNTDITHSGTGILYLGGGGTDNDFVGTITVDGGGILRNLRNPTATGKFNSLGDYGNTMTVTNGSTFDAYVRTNGHDFQNYGTGSFIFEDGTTLTNMGTTLSNDLFSDQLVFDGDVTLDGLFRFDIHGTINVTGTDIVITMENDAGNVLTGDNSGQSIAEWVVNDGQLIVANDNALSSASVTVNPGGALRANIAQGAGVRTIANDVTLNGGQIEVGYQNSIGHYTGTITVAADSVIVPNDDDGDNRELHLTGALTGSSNVTLKSGRTVFASSLDLSAFTGDFILEKITSRALQFELEDGINVTQDIIVADVGNFKNIIVAAGNSAEISGNITVNDSNSEDFDFDVQDATATLTVSGNISGTGAAGVTKTSAGSLILSGTNTYTGNSRIYNGTVTLAVGGSQAFYPTANGTTNQVNITGGTLNANGEIYFDLGGADTTAGNVWPIIIGGGTVVPGLSLTVDSSLGAFTNNLDGTFSLDDGSNVWVFSGIDGTLSIPSDSAFSAWGVTKGLTPGVNDGPSDDPDSDGDNLYEYFFWDSDPLVADVFGSELTGVDGSGAITGDLVFVHDRPQDISDVVVTYQWTADLTAGWTDSGVANGDTTVTLTPGATGAPANGNGTDYESVTVSAATTGTIPDKIFVRVSVTVAP